MAASTRETEVWVLGHSKTLGPNETRLLVNYAVLLGAVEIVVSKASTLWP